MKEKHSVQGHSIDQIAEKCGTPFFLYDGELLETNFVRLRALMSAELEIFYSLKANPNISVFGLLHRLGARAEVSSLAELATVIQAGVNPQNVIMVGPGKTEHEITAALEFGIYAIICESFEEIQTVTDVGLRLGQKPNIAIRINPGFAVKGSRLTMGGKPRQFGIDEAVAMATPDLASRFPGVHIRGIHVYSGTRILNWEEVVANTRRIFELANNWTALTGIPLEMVDIGGGLGVPYFDDEHPLDLERLATEMNTLILAFREQHPSTRLIMELGRYLSAEAGMLVSRVTYLKDSMGETFAITDGGTNCHMAAVGVGSFVKRNFPMLNLSNMGATPIKAYNVTGPLCTPNDVIGKGVKLGEVCVGDLVAVRNSGAYGPTASPTQFLSFGYPSEVLVYENKVWVVRERDTAEDMLRKQTLIFPVEASFEAEGASEALRMG